MAEQPPSRQDRDARKERPSSPSTPLPDRQGDQEHPKGWRVQPAANTDQHTAPLQAGKVQVNAKPPEAGRSLLANLLLGFGPTLLLVGLFIWFARRAARQGAGGGLMGFGKSGARRVEPSEQTVTFDDVAGIDEAKQELTELGDCLLNQDKYPRLGGRIPRGVLLSGAPGT